MWNWIKDHFKLIFLIVGVMFFVHLIVKYDMEAIWTNLMAIGHGIWWLFLLWLVALIVDTICWQYALGPQGTDISPFRLGMMLIAGQAINTLAPTGNLGEVVKGKLVNQHVSGSVSISSLVIYNYIHFVWGVVVLVFGAVLSVFLPEIPGYLSLAMILATAVLIGVTILEFFLLRWGLASKTMELLTRMKIPIKQPRKWLDMADKVDKNLHDFYRKYPKNFYICVLTKLISRVSAIVEIWVICYLLQKPITLFMALFIMSATILMYWLFTLVPSQLGVMEQGSDSLFGVVGFQPGFGFTFELVRRARRVFQIAVGLLALLVLNVQGSVGKTVAPEDAESEGTLKLTHSANE